MFSRGIRGQRSFYKQYPFVVFKISSFLNNLCDPWSKTCITIGHYAKVPLRDPRPAPAHRPAASRVCPRAVQRRLLHRAGGRYPLRHRLVLQHHPKRADRA